MRRLRLFLFFMLLGLGSAANAAVEIAFYSKDLASSFPHAYVRLTGADSTGRPFDVNYGFTPVRLSPAILFGAVDGKVESVGPEYVARSDRHFAFELTPDEYRKVVAIVESWRDSPQPSYRLGERNCVHFVAEVANALGLSAPVVPKLMKKPKSYLEMVTRRNSAVIAARASAPAASPARPAPQIVD